jgi:hypothetical protein
VISVISRIKIRGFLTASPALVAGALLAGCAWVRHVPPGQSLSTVMARKPELVALPAPPPQPVATTGSAAATTTARPVRLAGPAQGPVAQTESVADAFTLGNLCMQQGRYPAAITAYEAALKADPTFAEAWNNLAIAYQDIGQDDKALAAFRKYKAVAVH